MKESDMKYFYDGMEIETGKRGLRTQEEIGRLVGLSSVSISRFKNGEPISKRSARKIADALNVTVEALVDLGRTKSINRAIPISPTNQVNPADILKGLTALIEKYDESKGRLQWWRSVYENSPVASLILRDGEVCAQNAKSRLLGNCLGEEICKNCINKDDCDRDTCAIALAIETKTPQESYKVMDGSYYHITVQPWQSPDHQYYIVMADEISECGKAAQSLAKINAERKFLASCKIETPQYYADVDKNVTYVNDSFLDVFRVTRDELTTTDQFLKILNDRLFSPKKIVTMATEARLSGKPSNSLAKLGQEMYWFNFVPHVIDGQVLGVAVYILDSEEYQWRVMRGEIKEN